MRKTEFIHKYLGNKNYRFTDEHRELMYDDLCRVIDYANELSEECESDIEDGTTSIVSAATLPRDFVCNLRVMIEDRIQELENSNAAPCCAYEDRVNGSRCWNCGDPPKKVVPNHLVKLKYMHAPSRNQNSDFSL